MPTRLPLGMLRSLAELLQDWAAEKEDKGTVEDAAKQFGVNPDDIRVAVSVTPALEIRRVGIRDVVARRVPDAPVK